MKEYWKKYKMLKRGLGAGITRDEAMFLMREKPDLVDAILAGRAEAKTEAKTTLAQRRRSNDDHAERIVKLVSKPELPLDERVVAKFVVAISRCRSLVDAAKHYEAAVARLQAVCS
jgi:hypothetical protein